MPRHSRPRDGGTRGCVPPSASSRHDRPCPRSATGRRTSRAAPADGRTGRASHARCAARTAQHPRPQIAPARPRQDQQPGVVRHQMKASILGAEVPPDPAVACPTLQRRGREHRQGEPRTVTMRDVPQRVPDLGQRPEIMVRLHQLLEPSFLLRADNIDDDFGQSHRSSSTLNGLVRVTSYHRNEGLTRPEGNILKVPDYSAGTDPPCWGSCWEWTSKPCCCILRSFVTDFSMYS